MSNRFLGLSILGIVVSFIGGFFLSNALNRNEINGLKTENAQLIQNVSQGKKTNLPPSLSKKEIQNKLKEAEQNKDNFAFQKGLGLALYRYAGLRQDNELLPDIVKLLERANVLNSEDYDVLVSLGNVYFDIGRGKKENSKLEKAREFYKKALVKNEKDVNVRVDLGLTYFLSAPPDYEKALSEYKEALKINSKHEKSLQVTVQVLLKLKHKEEAGKYLQTLKQVNPQNSLLVEFQKQISNENNK